MVPHQSVWLSALHLPLFLVPQSLFTSAYTSAGCLLSAIHLLADAHEFGDFAAMQPSPPTGSPAAQLPAYPGARGLLRGAQLEPGQVCMSADCAWEARVVLCLDATHAMGCLQTPAAAVLHPMPTAMLRQTDLFCVTSSTWSSTFKNPKNHAIGPCRCTFRL